MATLEKLSICGIRSFGHKENDVQTISFQRPLTLILGENGCGKSTIIECLRFITTQREPSGKTSVFVHDPNLGGVSTIKGNIKLQFRDVVGESVVLNKIVQATCNRRNITTKTVDLTINRHNQNLSGRCGDVMSEVISAFGISRAILENVIFCTQEDSLWPLDTDQKVKEKFDQIFDSDRFNKCMKKMSDQRKKYDNDCKSSEKELKHLTETKKLAAKKRNNVTRLEKEMNDIDEQQKQFDNDIVSISNKLQAAHQIRLQISEIETKHIGFNTELNETLKRAEELKRQIREGGYEFAGSDEDLEKALHNFTDEINDMANFKLTLNQLDKDESEISKNMMNEQTKLGQLTQLNNLNRDKIINIDKFIENLASELKCNSDLISIQENFTSKQNELENLRVELELLEEAAQLEVDDARKKLVTEESLIDKKKEDLSENIKETNAIKNSLDDVDASQSRLSKLTSQQLKIQRDIEELQNNVNVDNMKLQLRNFTDIIKNKEEDLSTIESTIQMLQSQSQQLSEIELLKEGLNEKELQFRRLKNKHEAILKRFFSDIPESNFKSSIDSRLNDLKVYFNTLQMDENSKQREIAAKENEKRHHENDSKEKQAMLLENESKLVALKRNLTSENLGKSIDDVKKELEEYQIMIGTLTSTKYMLGRYIKKLEKKDPSCPVCKRGFERLDDSRNLITELKQRINSLPEDDEANQRNLSNTQNLLDCKQRILSIEQSIAKIKSDLSITNDKLTTVKSDLDILSSKLKKICENIIQPKKDIEDLSAIQSHMHLLDQLMIEQNNKKVQIVELEARLPKNIPTETLKDVQERHDVLKREIKKIKYDQDDVQSQLNRFYEKQQMLQSAKNSMEQDMKRFSGIGNRKELDEKLAKYLSVREKLETEISDLNQNLRKLENDVDKSLTELRSMKESNKMIISKKQQDMDMLNKKFDTIKNLKCEIDEFESKNIDEQLEEVNKSLDVFEKKKKDIKTQKDAINFKLNNLSKNDSLRRELEDNVAYRKKVKDCEVLKLKVRELADKLKNLRMDPNLQNQDDLQSNLIKINSTKQEIGGRFGALKQQLEDLKRELNGKLFKNVDEVFKKELIEYEVNKSLIQDLFRYEKAMGFALMMYHKQKMEQVNAMAREYWCKIYQGNDIDYIEIQTDETEVSDRRRNYTYKLVQVKGDTKLDMRNRCSAGQKMLAALIIRMALAYTFSSNCGILTLDEPTTNLDRKNIHNLALMLQELLIEREKNTNSNFQLIIITHDQTFLEELIQVNGIEHYVEVSRNPQGKSRISKKSVLR